MLTSPVCASVLARLCVTTSGTANLIPCGAESYATAEPARAVTEIVVVERTARGGTTTVMPADGMDRTPPRTPILFDAVMSDARGEVRLSGMTVVGVPSAVPRRPPSNELLADVGAAIGADGAADGATGLSPQPAASRPAVSVAATEKMERKRIWRVLGEVERDERWPAVEPAPKQPSCHEPKYLFSRELTLIRHLRTMPPAKNFYTGSSGHVKKLSPQTTVISSGNVALQHTARTAPPAISRRSRTRSRSLIQKLVSRVRAPNGPSRGTARRPPPPAPPRGRRGPATRGQDVSGGSADRRECTPARRGPSSGARRWCREARRPRGRRRRLFGSRARRRANACHALEPAARRGTRLS